MKEMPFRMKETPLQRVISDENVRYFPHRITLFFEDGECEIQNFCTSKEAADFIDKIRKPDCYKKMIKEIIFYYKSDL